MATDSQGGYEYDFVDADTLPDRILCQICHYPCREARLTGCRAGATDFVVVRLIFERAFNARQLKFSAKILGF